VGTVFQAEVSVHDAECIVWLPAVAKIVVPMRRDGTFTIRADFDPQGDQPQAIEALVRGLESGAPHQVLLGVTGSGKTFTVSHVIQRMNKPALVIAPNKTLAAQLYHEFRTFFPDNAVRYFVSYYDYYQPEAYVPATDTYIEKDAAINDEIDKMRHAATKALLERNDVIVVASVSCIYGLGSPSSYFDMLVMLERDDEVERDVVLRKLVDMQYRRSDHDFARGTFRVRGDVLEIYPAYEESRAVRVEFFGDTVERIAEIDPLRGTTLRALERVHVYPASHYVATEPVLKRAVSAIREELGQRLRELERDGKQLEAQRLEQRTMYDIELLTEMGFCPGIENYSRHLDGRAPGEPPYTLLDYFPDDFLMVLDESHVTVPQLGAMYRGDRSRKTTLVDFGFRLPCALDNRPLSFDEFTTRIPQALYVSATPGPWELERAADQVVEQLIRPTGLMDPAITVRPARHQVDDLLGAVRERIAEGDRTLVTTLTKKMAEDLTDYMQDLGIKVRYIHSDVDTIERTEIIRDLRRGTFDVLVGINLLREGLDLPEVSLVAILDADKEGYLRSERSLIQTIGRAARNVRGQVLMYADRTTDSMRRAIEETERRRAVQAAFNEVHGITPSSIRKAIAGPLLETVEDEGVLPGAIQPGVAAPSGMDPAVLARRAQELRAEMRSAARDLDFERAAALRDEARGIEAQLLGVAVADDGA